MIALLLAVMLTTTEDSCPEFIETDTTQEAIECKLFDEFCDYLATCTPEPLPQSQPISDEEERALLNAINEHELSVAALDEDFLYYQNCDGYLDIMDFEPTDTIMDLLYPLE